MRKKGYTCQLLYDKRVSTSNPVFIHPRQHLLKPTLTNIKGNDTSCKKEDLNP